MDKVRYVMKQLLKNFTSSYWFTSHFVLFSLYNGVVLQAAQIVLISLFELNTPEFTMLLGALPKTFQDRATKLLHNHLKNSSNAAATVHHYDLAIKSAINRGGGRATVKELGLGLLAN